MPRLFVEKSIEVNAPAARVWDVLTNPALSREWIREWWPELAVLESDWNKGSPVRWKLADGVIGADGKVFVVEPHKMLRFSFKVNDPASSKQEDLTYRLKERGGRTELSVSVGDFGDTLEHRQRYPGALEAWNRSLAKIKELAEAEG